MDKEQIKRLLERVGEALTDGDEQRVSACWQLPALVLSEQGAFAVQDPTQMRHYFAHAIDWYRARGLSATHAEVEHVDMLSDRLAAVDVRWPVFDASGNEKMSERSHYIVQLGQDELPYIRVALTRTQ